MGRLLKYIKLLADVLVKLVYSLFDEGTKHCKINNKLVTTFQRLVYR